MAELGSLHVSLSLDASSFNGSISQVNRQMRAMGGELQSIRAKGIDYERSIDGLSQKQNVLQRSLNASSIKLQETRKRYDELVASGKASDAQIERAAIAVNRAQAEYNRLEKELADVTRELKIQSSMWTQAGQRLEAVGGKLKSIGSGMASIGKDLSMKVTAPIVAMGAGILKAGIDFEASMSKVQALSGATGAEMAKLEEQAKELGATTAFSASQAADGMAFLAMAGWETSDIIAGMPGLLDLAASGALDLGRAADITSNIMSAFSIEASKAGHVADVLAAAASNANTNVEQMGLAMTYLAPVANTLGWTLEESAAAVMAMSDAGIQGEKAGAAFATSLQRLANPTKAMKNVMEELNITFFDAEGQIKPLPQLIGELEQATQTLTSEQKAAALSTIFGAEAYKNWAVLLETGSDSLASNTKMLVEADGAAKQMADTMMDNAKGAIVEFKSAIEGISIQLSEHLLPFVTQAVDKLTEMVRGFGELSPATQKTILAIGGVVAAAGPLLVIGGSIMSGIGGLVTTFGALSTAVGSAGGAIALLSNPIGWVVGAIAGFTAGVGLLYTKWDEFKNASPLFQGAITALFAPIVGVTSAIKGIQEVMKPAIETNDAWKDSVSEATAEVVSSYLDLENKATTSLNQLAWSGQEVTQEMAGNLISIYDEMGKQIIDEMQQDHAEQLQMMADYFAQSSALTEQEEQEIIAAMQTKQVEKEQIISDGQTRIAEILNKAKEEKRGITLAEQQEINQIQQTMTENAIRYLSENEREQKVILENLKNEASKITAEQAAEVVKNSIKQKDEVINEANLQYKNVVSEIIKQRDEMGTISEEQARKLIDEAKKQRDETIKNAQDMHLKVVEEAQKQAEEHVNKVDWETGEIKTKWEVMKGNISDKASEIKTNVSKKWEEIKSDTSKKWEEIKGWPGKKLEEMKTEVRTKTAEIVTDVTGKFNEIKIAVEEKIEGARKAVSDAIDKIKGYFDFEWSLPKLKLPKIKIDGEFSLNPPKVPKFNVEWFAKGGIMTKPTVFGAVGNKLLAGGEAGPEAILPLNNKYLSQIGEAIANTLNLNALNKLAKLLDNIQSFHSTSTVNKSYTSGDTHIHVYSPNPTPSEIARKNTQAQRQLAMEWGVL